VLNPCQFRLTGSISTKYKLQAGNAVPKKKLEKFCERDAASKAEIGSTLTKVWCYPKSFII